MAFMSMESFSELNAPAYDGLPSSLFPTCVMALVSMLRAVSTNLSAAARLILELRFLVLLGFVKYSSEASGRCGIVLFGRGDVERQR